MNGELIIAFFERFADPDYRETVIFTAFFFTCAGFAAGFLLSPAYSNYRVAGWARKDLLRKKEEETRRNEIRRRETELWKQREAALETAMAGLHWNSQKLMLDEAGNVYCQDCMDRAVRTQASKDRNGGIYCARCGWQCPVASGQIL